MSIQLLNASAEATTEGTDLLDTLMPLVTGAAILAALIIGLFALVVGWRFYRRGYCPGWACLIPFYNLYCYFKIAYGNGWLFLLSFVPIVNVVMAVATPFMIAKNYGKGFFFGLGFLFFPFFFRAVIAFGDLYYCGPNL